jgi:hypothetical protein
LIWKSNVFRYIIRISLGIVLCNLLNFLVPGIIKYTDVSFRPQKSRVRKTIVFFGFKQIISVDLVSMFTKYSSIFGYM